MTAEPDVANIYYGHPGIMGAAIATNGMVTHPWSGAREAGQSAATMGAWSVDGKHFCDLYLPDAATEDGPVPLIIYTHGRDSDKRHKLIDKGDGRGLIFPEGSAVNQRIYFIPYLTRFGYAVLSFNYLQCNDLFEQDQIDPPTEPGGWDDLWIELWRNRALQGQRMVDFAIDDFDLSDHTAKWTVDPDAIFWCGSSMGCSMMLHTMVATGPGKPITLPAFANKANLAGVIHQWGSLPDVAGGGGIYMTFNEDDPFFDVGDKPILIEHGTHDNLQTESGMLLTPWTAAVALYRDALNVEIPFTEIIPLMQAHHSPWASHHSEIAYGMRDWIARVMAGESTPVIQTELDKELVPEVYTLIDELGEAVIFEVADGLLYSLKITPPEPFQDSFIDNDVIREGDLTTYVAAKDIPFTPAPGIKMTLESKDYTVIKVSPIYTGELIALYTLHLR